MSKRTASKVFGKVCKKHTELSGKRYAKTNECVGCCAESQARYYQKNKAKAAEKNSKWWAAHPEAQAEKCRLWVVRNKAARAEYMSAYRSSNKALYAKHTANRRSYLLRATPGWANEFFIEEAYMLSAQRSVATGKKWEVDHIVPLKSLLVCGLHCESNLRVVEMVVNRRKGNKHVVDTNMHFQLAEFPT